MELIYNILQATFFTMTPLLVVALGGLFSERSGVEYCSWRYYGNGSIYRIFVISMIEGGSILVKWVLIIGVIVGGLVGNL